MRDTSLVVLLLLTLVPGLSQPPPGHGVRVYVMKSNAPAVNDIEGFVYDQTGQTIGNVLVVVRNMRSGEDHMVSATEDGWYKISGLETADSYEITVTSPSFENFGVKGVNIGWKIATHFDIVLRRK